MSMAFWPDVRHIVRQSYKNLESGLTYDQIFTRTFTPVGSTIPPDMNALVNSDWQLSKFKKNVRKCRLRRRRVEFLKNGLSGDHEIFHAYRVLDMMTSSAVSGRLQSAIKYRTKVRKT